MCNSEPHTVTYAELVSIDRERTRYLRLAYSYVRDMDVAEDIFQDCLLQLMKNQDTVMITNLKSYFASAVKNRCLNHHLRKQVESRSKQNISRRIILAEDIRILSQKSDDDMIFNADIDELTRKCRAKLSPLSFNVFSAHKFEHLSYKEIAGIFGITVRQVNAEIQKAAKVFRDEFRDYLPLVAGLIFLVGGGSIWGNI